MGDNMELDSNIIKRLSFIKYLYGSAVEQSKMPAPMSSASLLTFHDSSELFLHLVCEYLDINKKGNGFMEYWELLSNKVNISQKESMRKLNKARVNLKHYGTLPSELDLESFRATVTNFFEENTPVVFGVEFPEISLIDLIQCTEAKNSAKKADNEFKNGNLQEALNNISFAFFYLIEDYENRKRDRYGRSPFFFGESMTFNTSFHMGLRRTGMKELDRLGEFVDKSQKAIESMRDAMKILSLGIDYRKYTKFKLLTPNIVKTFDGPRIVRV